MFHPDEIRSTNWTGLDRYLGVLNASDNHPQSNAEEEWLDNDAGWIQGSVTISVPFPRRAQNPGPRDYVVKNFFHRTLLSIIRERLLDRTLSKDFRFEPYELRWDPAQKESDIGVYGELFTSPAFLQAHQALQESPPEPGCSLPRRVVALMFWSDATQLTTFGNAKLWPLYLYFGNDSKYQRCRPSANLCSHVAYFQTVGVFFCEI